MRYLFILLSFFLFSILYSQESLTELILSEQYEKFDSILSLDSSQINDTVLYKSTVGPNHSLKFKSSVFTSCYYLADTMAINIAWKYFHHLENPQYDLNLSLGLSASDNNMTEIKLLIDKGAYPFAQGIAYNSLRTALTLHYEELSHYLIQLDPPDSIFFQKDEWESKNCFHAMVTYNDPKVTDQILNRFDYISGQDINGFSPSMYSAQFQDINQFQKLYQKDTSNHISNLNVSLLHLASLNYYHPEVLNFLLEENKHDINLQDEQGETPLMYALYNKNFEHAHLLLEKNLDLNLIDKGKWTYIHYAVMSNSLQILEIIDSKVTFTYDKSLLDFAKKYKVKGKIKRFIKKKMKA